MSVGGDMFNLDESIGPGAPDSAPAEDESPTTAGDRNVLVKSMRSLRRDLTNRLSRLQDEMTAVTTSQRELKDQMTSIRNELTAGLDAIKKLAEDEGSLRPPLAPKQKRKRMPKVSFAKLHDVTGPLNAREPLATWTIISTVLSFVFAMPTLRFWVSDTMFNALAAHQDIISGSQGFGLIKFSMKNSSKAMAETGPGKLWMFVVGGALRSVILNAKSKFRPHARGAMLEGTSAITQSGASAEPNVDDREESPEWLTRFTDENTIDEAVTDSMTKFAGIVKEGTLSVSSCTGESSVESPKRTSRKRKADEKHFSPERIFRRDLVTRIRMSWSESMNIWRQQVRKHLYMHIAAVLDRIAYYKSVSVARENGFEIILHGYENQFEDIAANTLDLAGTIWDISDAHVGDAAKTDMRNTNVRKRLARNFPSMHVTICYQRVVKTLPGAVQPNVSVSAGESGVAQGGVPVRIQSCREKMSLHEVAQGVLMDIFCVDSMKAVRAISELSLKAVHVIALALRALIFDVLDSCRERKTGLSVTEKAAFGNDVSLTGAGNTFNVLTEKHGQGGTASEFYTKCFVQKFETAKDEENSSENVDESQEGEIAACPKAVLIPGEWMKHK